MIIVCDFCGKKSARQKSYVARVKNNFCDLKCLASWKRKNVVGKNNPNWGNGAQIKCRVCGKEFRVILSRGKSAICCSLRCRGLVHSKLMRGENAPNWQGGITPLCKRRMLNKKWLALRIRCYKRDGYKCQTCGKTFNNTRLNAHHIIPWIFTKDDSLSNLITLCMSCHQREEALIKKELCYGNRR